jgi:hypothetical protein
VHLFPIASFFIGSEVRFFFPTQASFAWRFSGRALNGLEHDGAA